MALRICREYDPALMVLSYATGAILRANTPMDDAAQHSLNRHIVAEAMRFAQESGYEPILVSNGGLQHFERVLDTDEIEGYISDGVDKYMAGIFYPTEKDFETVKTWPGVDWESGEEFIKRYNISDKYALDRTPGIVLYADEHTAFTRLGNRGTYFYMNPIKSKYGSCWSKLENVPDDIFDFRPFIDAQLEQGKKIAVIVVEDVDEQDMPEGSKRICQYRNGIYYSRGVSFYYALLNSREFFEVGMPYIFHNKFLKKSSENRFPYSYIKTEHYQNPIGYNRSFRTAAMATRSGIVHSAAMCDYAFECHCRGMAETGLLVFINSEKLG